MLTIRTAPRYASAVAAIDELLTKLRIEHLFVGEIARAAWLGGFVDGGSIDVLGLMQPEQKNSVAMMASNRGFRVDREEIEATEELDLIPLGFEELRVHVLVASNALYARMFATAHVGRVLNPSADPSPEPSSDRELRVPAAEDLALMLRMSEDDDAVRQLAARPEFDRALYNQKLISIGLAAGVIPDGEAPNA